jgi:peptidoglycan/LPS O-acetylase OafA/YrhL
VPWMVLTAVFVAATVATCASNPYAWVDDNYYWIDLLVACATVSLIVAMAIGKASGPVAFLSWKPVAGLGAFSYSLYLVHAPLLQVFWQLVVQPFGMDRNGSLVFVWAVGVPLIIVSAYLFYLLAERPFVIMAQRRRILGAASPQTPDLANTPAQ